MKSMLFLSACGLVLAGLSACAPTTRVARTALDCPASVGDLKLDTIAPDKKTCAYTSRQGDQVSLRLIQVATDYQAALQPIEQELQGEVLTDQQAADARASNASSVAAGSSAAAKAAAKSAKEAADDARGTAGEDTKGKGAKAGDKSDDEEVNVPGVHIGAGQSGGDHAHIDLPGIHISADDENAKVNVGNNVQVDAGDDGATVRMSRDVRLRGEALSREKRGFRATYILAKDNLKDGWRAVGYEAAGPKTGPVAVAVFKAHEGRRHDVADDVKRLVRHNAGV